MANIIYEQLFEQTESFKQLKNEGKLVKTLWKGKSSENSYCFNVGIKTPSNTKEYKNSLLQTIKLNFGITNSAFDEKFKKAIGGAGQEWRRLHVFHSSSLLTLLCFYNVSEKSPLTITIEGKVCCFTESEFECENLIGENKKNKSYYSYVDVKLSGKRDDGQSVTLYLESKFSEYVNHRGSCKFPNTDDYKDIYEKLDGKIDNLKITIENDQISLTQTDRKRPAQYWKGIKQMVSHYLGMRHCNNTSENIYLGEIVYDFSTYNKIAQAKEYFDNYKGIHKQLAKELNSIKTTSQNVKVIENLLTYQEVFKGYKLDELVRKHYLLTNSERG